MHQIRIFYPQYLQVGERVRLNPDVSHRLKNVLRLAVGAQFILFDGENHEFLVEIIVLDKKYIEIQALTAEMCIRESPCKIHLAQGIAKTEHWQFSLQKAVELGVFEISPLWTQHVSYRWDKDINQKKMSQWQAIVVAAAEQSGRTKLPILNEIQSFDTFVHRNFIGSKWILDPNAERTAKDLSRTCIMDAVLMIGPEGGFSRSELAVAKDCEFQGLSMGPRTLRTETAVLTVISILQAVHGDL